MNKVKYYEIKNALNYYNVNPKSKINDTEFFHSLSSLNSANKSQLTFFHDRSKLNELKNTKAKACLIHKDNLHLLPLKCIPIIVNDPYKAFAILSNLFTLSRESNGEISKFSSIDNNSKIADNVQIDPFVVIKENCNVGKNVIIESNCAIGPNVNIGDNSVIKSNSILLECLLGMNCTVKSGAVIGGTGFGFDAKSKILISHNGNVIIKDNCHIGSNTTIDRAVFDSTFISENSFIDNLVQIAHNVFIGKGAIIASQSGIAGSTTIGDNVIIGGQAGISGHLTIGKNVTIAAKSGVTKNLNDNSIVAGFPAIDIKKWKLNNIKINKL